VETEKILTELNEWWYTGSISDTLAKPYRRKVFDHILKLFRSYRQIILLTGLRRVGKTTIIFQLISEILKSSDKRSILYYTFDAGVKDLVSILDEYTRLTGISWKKERVHLFLDEVQKLPNWSNQVKLLYDSFPKIKIVLSGSASLKLQKDAFDNLVGRHFAVEIHPLSIVEFHELRQGERIDRIELFKSKLKDEFEDYLLRQFPEVVTWQSEIEVRQYIREQVTARIIRGDIPDTFSGVNFRLLEGLVNLFYSKPGMIINVDQLSKDFRVSKTTLENHLFYLEFSLLIRSVKNYRPSLMSESRKMKKVYPYNVALAMSLYKVDRSYVYETLVAGMVDAHHYWREGNKEIDFVLKEPLRAIEVKSSERVEPYELRSIEYFVDRLDAEGFVVYLGQTRSLNKIILYSILDFAIDYSELASA
jgi:predicted AAA+ superfamily ATPase